MISQILLLKDKFLRGTRTSAVAWMNCSGLALLASLAAIPFPANAQSQSWPAYGTPLRVLQQKYGSQVLSFISNTEMLTNNMTLTVYKSPTPIGGYDYYLIAGPFSHSVTPGANNGAGTGWTNFMSNTSNYYDLGVGWCGATMRLDLYAFDSQGESFDISVPQAAPQSTNDLSSNTTTLTLSTGGVSYQYSHSIDAPDVAIATKAGDNQANYTATLPCPSASDSFGLNAQNPHPTSMYGTTLQVAAGVRVPHGRGLRFNWDNDIWWRFYSQRTSNKQPFAPTSTTTTNNNLYNTGTVVADFGAAPIYNADGSLGVPADGPQLVDFEGRCATALSASTVAPQACNASSAQQWYYTANSQIVNAQTNTCLDIQYPQGGSVSIGSRLVLNPCTPALPTAACNATQTCNTSTVSTQEWQLSASQNSPNSPVNLLSASGLVATPFIDGTHYILVANSSLAPFNLRQNFQ